MSRSRRINSEIKTVNDSINYHKKLLSQNKAKLKELLKELNQKERPLLCAGQIWRYKSYKDVGLEIKIILMATAHGLLAYQINENGRISCNRQDDIYHRPYRPPTDEFIEFISQDSVIHVLCKIT